VKTPRERMEIVDAYETLGSYRAAAALCGTTHKTVKRLVAQRKAGTLAEPRAKRPQNTDGIVSLVEEKVRLTQGRISAKRLLPQARAAGYTGSARNFRRAVAEVKATCKAQRRTYRPWTPTAGAHLVIDWGTEGEHHLFCAVLAWSRYRFLRVATNERRETTLQFLAECFEELGGVPAVVLSDRMGCLIAGVVANVVVPHPDYVRFATHYGFRPDFCEAADPESKGVVEALVGYAQRDCLVPLLADSTSAGAGAAAGSPTDAANHAARAWCTEVNGQRHSEIAAIPAERLVQERPLLRSLPGLRPPLRTGVARKVDRLSTVRFGSARYSVPVAHVGQVVEVAAQEGIIIITAAHQEIARHPVVAPGEVSILDAHYGHEPQSGPRQPNRPVRPRHASELAFLSLGPVAEPFLRAAAAAGTLRLQAELAEIVALDASWGRPALLAALERALRFRRFTARDLRAILQAGPDAPTPVAPGVALDLGLPAVPTRPLSAYALEVLQ
jgi:transposase